MKKKIFFFIFSETLEFSYGAKKNNTGKILALKNISKMFFYTNLEAHNKRLRLTNKK